MAIKINDIPPEGLTLELSQKLDLFDAGTATTPFFATFTIKPSGNGTFHLSGSVKAETTLECSRCLKLFPYDIQESRLDVDLVPVRSLRSEAEHELDHAELDVEFFNGDEIEPIDLIKEQLLLAVPMVPLHSPDCKGLCPVCGTDLNEKKCGCPRESEVVAGPLSALKDILNKKKE